MPGGNGSPPQSTAAFLCFSRYRTLCTNHLAVLTQALDPTRYNYSVLFKDILRPTAFNQLFY